MGDVSDKFTREDYADIKTVDDMKLPRYRELQSSLNEIRNLNSTRYLYTAKRGDCFCRRQEDGT